MVAQKASNSYYITPEGYANCHTVQRSKGNLRAIDKEVAKQRGYEACGVCRPPK